MVDTRDLKSLAGNRVPVRVRSPAPRQNKAMRSCGGTSTATSTDDLVFPFQPRPADAGLASDRETGSDLDWPGAPEKGKSCSDFPFSGAAPLARMDPLRSNAKEDSRPLSRSSHADLKVGSDLNCLGAPRQKNSAPFRFRGFRKSRENCISAASFFLSKSEVSRGTSDLVCGEKTTDTL